MIIFESLTYDLIGITIALAAVVIVFLRRRYSYWSNKGVLNLPSSIPFGDASAMMKQKENFGELWARLYNEFKGRGLKFGGAYFMAQPMLVPTDIELIKNMMTRDFAHFVNHGGYCNEEADPLTGNLFNLEDTKWKNTRIKLTPTFTSGKMKMMFQTLADCAVGLVDVMDNAAKNNQSVDIKDVLGCFTTDIIGSCAFGIECNSLKNPSNEFRVFGKRIFELSTMDKIRTIMIPFFVPRIILNALKYKASKADVEEFILRVVKDNVEYREKNNIYRKDFMHLLIQLKNLGKVTDDEKISDGQFSEKGFTMNEIAAQAFVFFAAGFETSSTLMTFALYELCLNKSIQDKLREEVRTVLAKHNNKVTYDAINEMTYMERVCQETLRKYPPVPVHTRNCNKDYKIPNTDIVIEKGTMVAIPVLGIQNDPEYYPNPEVFDPERFTEENKATRPAFSWIPFGEGPRLCIGLRFGMMQSKVGLTTLLQSYEISLNKSTTFPLTFDKNSFILSSAEKILIDVKKIN